MILLPLMLKGTSWGLGTNYTHYWTEGHDEIEAV